MKITQAENEAACSRCNRNQIPLIQLKQYSAFYCLICLRAAVQMLEGQQHKEQRVCHICEEPITKDRPAEKDWDGDPVHETCI